MRFRTTSEAFKTLPTLPYYRFAKSNAVQPSETANNKNFAEAQTDMTIDRWP